VYARSASAELAQVLAPGAPLKRRPAARAAAATFKAITSIQIKILKYEDKKFTKNLRGIIHPKSNGGF